MTCSNQEEYKTAHSETVSIQKNDANGKWEVASWGADDENRWYLEFDREDDARTEFERWRPQGA